jgi:propane monooxygenase reductase subunit
MANVSAKESGQLEFLIKCYPGGLFSEFCNTTLAVGDALPVSGPFGVFTLRDSPADLVFVGGGAGMAPILSVLRSLAERDPQRKATFYYGARTERDLFFEDELHALAAQLPAFRYVPALSEPVAGEPWDGEVGFVTDVVRKHETDLRRADAYVCGPPPMVEAAIDVLTDLGAKDGRIFYDKFTTTGEPTANPVTGRAST